TTQANGDLDVFVRDSAGVLWQKHMVGGAWKDWWKVTVGGSAEVFVTDVTSVAGSSSVACPAGYTKLPDNTVNGMSTNYVFVCVQYGTKANALNWISVTYDRSVPNCWTGTDKRGVDLRKGAGGLYDFLCVTQRMSGRSAIRDVGIHSFDYTTGSDTIEGCKGPKWPLPANPWRGGGWTSVDNYLAGTSNMGPGPINGGGLFDKKPDNWMFLCYMN
ncbi:MAG: hypothetical protein NTZ05_21805, partial [Chloroflexi bacterium]|nr:hypothetical protein [Chloroflexota bacterium]